MRFSRTIKLNEVKFIRRDWENSRGESEICFSDEYTFAVSGFAAAVTRRPSLVSGCSGPVSRATVA